MTKWRVTVTTAPRPIDTLRDTLESLGRAGWLEEEAHVVRDDGRGAWPNFLRSLADSLEIHDWDVLLACQDDILVSTGARAYVERCDMLGESLLSLYTCGANLPAPGGWWRLTDLPRSAYGALCYALPREFVRSIVAAQPAKGSRTKIDIHVANFCKRSGVGYWTHTPSLVKHTGVISAISPDMPWNPMYRDAADWEESPDYRCF